MLQVRAQTTRFQHTTAEVWSGSLQILDLDISVHSGPDVTPLLEGATLSLSAGHVYGLCGRNGVGKSSLLRAIADRLIEGFPRELSVLFVEQVAADEVSEGTTALQYACFASTRRREVQALLSLLNDALSADAKSEVGARLAEYARARCDHTGESQRIVEDASLRSGKRGVRARQALVAHEAEQSSALQSGPGAAARVSKWDSMSEEEQVAFITSQIDKLGVELEVLEVPQDEEARAKKVLRGLGFDEASMARPYSQLSGGWRTRACLARGLLAEPDMLLLDEPTNSCDIDAVLWLQRYLVSFHDGASIVLVATHDQVFLDAIATDVVLMRDRKLTYYVGNYSEYMEQWTQKRSYDARMKASIEAQRGKAADAVASAKQLALKAGDDKRAAMLAGKQRKMEERSGLNRNAKGHRFKLNRDRAGFHNTLRDDVTVDEADVDAITFQQPSELRHAAPILEVEDVSYAYDAAATRPILRGVTLNMELGERVAIIGANGLGKSTFVNLISGDISPKLGSIRMHPAARVAHFSQFTVELLRGGPDRDSTALAYLLGRNGSMKTTEARAHLAKFGLKGRAATKVPLAQLSGGQAVRLKFAELWTAPPHLLVLDEPTNHLDIPMIDALTEALAAYPGAILFVSHDQAFVSNLAQKRVYTIEGGRLMLLQGGVAEYVASRSRKSRTRKQ